MFNLGVLALASLLCAPAGAQEGFDAYDLFLAPQDGDPRRPLVVHRPGLHEAGDVYASIALGGAGGTLRTATRIDGETTRTRALGQLATLNLVAGIAAHERVRVHAAAPFHLLATGPAAEGGVPGDLRLSSELVLVPPERGGAGFSLQAVPWVVLPTGRTDAFLGRNGIGGGGVMNAGYGVGRVHLAGEAGIDVNPATDAFNVRGDDELRLAASVSTLVDPHTAVGLEGRVEIPMFTDTVDPTLVPAEILGSVRQRSRRGAHWMAGAGAGLGRGIGAPAWRLIVGAGFGRGGLVDGDDDGFSDLEDLCPDEAETVNGWMDDDGCPDQLADVVAIPTIGGRHRSGAVVTGSSGESVYEETGRPLVLEELMPEEAWTFTGRVDCHEGAVQTTLVEGHNRVEVPMEPVHDATLAVTVTSTEGLTLTGATLTWLDAPSGCAPAQPPSLADNHARTPLGAGTHVLLLEASGHQPRQVEVTLARGAEEALTVALEPVRVTVHADHLELTERIHFEFDSARVKSSSLPLLREIATALRNLPDRGTVTIAGHADERGPDTYNDELSRRRAEAVRAHLVSLGVPPDRLEVRAFGKRRPLVTGTGDAVWAENRRVQFHLNIDDGDAGL